LLDELRGRGPGLYRLRRGGDVVLVRHGTRDVEILNEIFSHHNYRPPREAQALLAGRPIRVVDLGANIGLFTLYARQQWDVSKIACFEPDPENAWLLEAVQRSNGIVPGMRRVAVSNKTSTMSFRSGEFSESRAAEGDEHGVLVQAEDFFELDLDVDLVKMDIEGGEWSILTDPRMRSVGARAWVMEWHSRGCPAVDAHDEARRLLEAAGYRIVSDRSSATDLGTIWAVSRRAQTPI
jgi:FkbM family methyltransferase